MVSEKLYPKELELAKPRGDREVPGVLLWRPTENPEKIAKTPDSTSKLEESRFCRQGICNRYVRHHGSCFASTLAVRTQRGGASGNTPLPLSNCVHYVSKPVGEHLKYLVFTGQRPVACLIYSSVPRHIGCRDRFIGWPVAIRRQNLHLIAYQSRFLILPWIRVPHLASHLLGQMTKRLSTDWEGLYHHPVYFQETFVDLERFKGTCYKAANWLYLGKTTGRGKNDHTYKPNRSIKAVWGYPLCRDFRARLCKASG